MFSLDTETGFPDLVVINASWGLGETVVQGSVDPDEYRVFKPRLGEPSLVPILGKKLGGKEKKVVYANHGAQTTRTIDTPGSERRRRSFFRRRRRSRTCCTAFPDCGCRA